MADWRRQFQSITGTTQPRTGLTVHVCSSSRQLQVMATKARLVGCTTMAASRWQCSMKQLWFCLIVFGQPLLGSAKVFPSLEHVQVWGDNFRQDLLYKLNVFTGHAALVQSYNSGSKNGINFQLVNETALVENMSSSLSAMLSTKMEALWALVHAAEDAAKKYVPTEKPEKVNGSHYKNAKSMPDVQLVYDKHFKQEVNFTFSSVHIPVEIYDGDSDILNGLNWTSQLDEQFMKNLQNDRTMLWQYFGSQTGFMRTYPASRWETHGDVDLFDVRRQSWYTQGSSSPKDMLILIDTSGSTHGQALQLMKNAVKSILDTLGENDFVNIVRFSNDADYVSACFNHTPFVQANYRNKKQLERDVDKLEAQNQADYKAGLRFAFQKFEEFSANQSSSDKNIGANCNKVIILLTDGGTDNAEDVFKEYNWPNKSVRVFTYAVGPTATPVAAIKWMACANRGYFSHIPAMGAIRARVQEYIPVLSRPQVLKNAKVIEWGNIYRDHLGLGMMTTVTLPVYNRTEGSSNQTILGVMGIDVTTSQLEKYTPHLKIGPNGYSFAINPNGYAVFHPNLKRSQGRYMKDPPNIDLLELEVEGDRPGLLELRNQMIEGDRGIITMNETLFLSPDKQYVSHASANYAFTSITNTTFRLGLSVPLSHRQYPEFSKTLPDFKNYTNHSSKSAFLIAPWDYLGEKTIDFALNNTLGSLIEILHSGSITTADLSADDIQMLQHLAWDVGIAVGFELYFALVQENLTSAESKIRDIADIKTKTVNLHHADGLRVNFMATNGGLTVICPASEAALMEDNLDVRNASYYTRAVYALDDYILMADRSLGLVSNDSYITVVAARSVTLDKPNNYTAAVVGAMLDGRVIKDFMVNSSENSSISRVNNLLTCGDVDDIYCYLVDDGGFVVSSNQEEHLSKDQLGKFLGEVDPQLWNFFYNNSVYRSVTQYDFQSVCKVLQKETSAGHRSFFVPTLNVLYEVLSVNWWTSKISWAYMNFNIYQWLFGSSDAYADTDSDGDEEKDCSKATHQYYFQPGMSNFTDSISCLNCTREIRMVMIQPKTNLMFVVTGKPCEGCPEMNKVVLHGPQAIDDEEEKSIICNLSMHPRKRVLSYGCYDHDPNEDDTKCGAGAIPRSGLLILATSFATAVAVWLLSQDLR
ncbi:voltage-dependent calcium channel subunit alpha-2/delta-2-like isoform X3 [Pomacea canaliculata]|uniref:voltage-dependent calcium channel subunit alpha-2/delta-2-like isoform X3 n=1 Tax=Pomacea canaliculata TaxID=400727 RepID=UPI000D729B4E|nr:voltage-dependent calcium channel subunit alpha-2/delta-2-like isoform X3 [Pomacea canaliculata]